MRSALSVATPRSAADSPWRAWFGDDLVAAHLDRLERDQQADGGWPITWEPCSPGAVA